MLSIDKNGVPLDENEECNGHGAAVAGRNYVRHEGLASARLNGKKGLGGMSPRWPSIVLQI